MATVGATVAIDTLIERPDEGGVDLPARFMAAFEHQRAGRAAEAETLYHRVILRQPAHAQAWSNLSLLLMERGALDDAVQACLTAIALQPGFADPHLNLIEVLSRAGRHEESVVVYRQAIALLPRRVDLRANLGVVLEALGRIDDALAAFADALQLQPDYALACLPAARLLGQAGRTDEAVAVYDAALAVRPDFVEALSNYGAMLGGLGRYHDAVAISGRAFELRPDAADIGGNFGVALHQVGRVAEAEAVYRHAAAVNPGVAFVHANRGVALQELLRFDEAVEAFDRAIALNPGYDTAIVEAIKVRRHICDWSRYDEDRLALIRMLEGRPDNIFMLLMMSFASTPAQQLASARLGMARYNAMAATREEPCADPRPAADGRLRIGYLSHDYREHPVGRLLPELFARHDRSRFAVTAYSLGKDDPGGVRQRIRAGVEAFVDLHPLSDREAVARIRADNIDILVDLTGPTIGARLNLLAAKPAPLLVSLLGWPGSMGLDTVDYVVADRILVPPGMEDGYGEKILRLPECYQPSDGARGTPDLPVTRAANGLPEQAFVFCSFNNTSKITPDTFACWMRILSKVPGSVLWLYCKTPQTIANLTATAARHGIAAERLVFAGFALTDEYLSRFRLADLFLDSLPYNAGATCNDALWSGLPVLTCVGRSYVGRMAASLLTTLGLPELIAATPAAYEKAAVRLATRKGGTSALKRKLAKAGKTSPLFDMGRYARHLESAFTAIALRHREGLAPDHIDVPAT